MTTNPFPGWFDDVAADPVVTLPKDTIAEAQGNLWTFGLDGDQRAVVTAADIEGFVENVVSARSRWLAEHGVSLMRFYCWYDAQAGQLRFSLISGRETALPFECAIEEVVDLSLVVRDFLAAKSPRPLRVWATVVP